MYQHIVSLVYQHIVSHITPGKHCPAAPSSHVRRPSRRLSDKGGGRRGATRPLSRSQSLLSSHVRPSNRPRPTRRHARRRPPAAFPRYGDRRSARPAVSRRGRTGGVPSGLAPKLHLARGAHVGAYISGEARCTACRSLPAASRRALRAGSAAGLEHSADAALTSEMCRARPAPSAETAATKRPLMLQMTPLVSWNSGFYLCSALPGRPGSRHAARSARCRNRTPRKLHSDGHCWAQFVVSDHGHWSSMVILVQAITHVAGALLFRVSFALSVFRVFFYTFRAVHFSDAA